MENNYLTLFMEMKRLILYRGILRDPVYIRLLKLFEDLTSENKIGPDIETQNLAYDYIAELIHQCEELGFSGDISPKYFLHLILNDENSFSIACEKQKMKKDCTLYGLAIKDMHILITLMRFNFIEFFQILNISCDEIFNYAPINEARNQFVDQANFAGFTPEQVVDQFVWYYSSLGCGIFSEYKMLYHSYEAGFVGIEYGDDVSFDSIVGYDNQKLAIMQNTEAFLSGKAANNMLLIGSRGTGKSSCVKALSHKYFDRGLRIIEIRKNVHSWEHLQELLVQLGSRGKYFLIFIDDICLDESELEYKQLNALLEGGLFKRPKNVLFCATSSLRSIEEASGGIEEDTVNENLSLFDRFGLTVTFPKPTPEQYLDIVYGIAKQEKVQVPEDILKSQAMEWEASQKGLSGRSARQFIDHFIWEIAR